MSKLADAMTDNPGEVFTVGHLEAIYEKIEAIDEHRARISDKDFMAIFSVRGPGGFLLDGEAWIG